MKIGVTGTREGLSGKRLASLRRFIYDLNYHNTTVLHGMCKGVDEQVNHFCFLFNLRTIGYPGTEGQARSMKCTDVLPVRPFLERNKDIVNDCDLLIGCPSDPNKEELRSGTWSTIRYARKIGKPILII